jgi:hypothetical protein
MRAVMGEGVRVIGTGVYIDTYPDPDDEISEAAATFGLHLSPETRGDLARWRAGELEFVRLTPFVEFDRGSGPERWEGTPQGPLAVPLRERATSTLLGHATSLPNDMLADLRIYDLKVSRFAYSAAPHRIDLDPDLADKLLLD